MGVDIRMTSVRLARVSGRVIDSRGNPSAGMVLVLMGMGQAGQAVVSTSDGSGQFVLNNVMPGLSRLDVMSLKRMDSMGTTVSVDPNDQSEFASVPVNVSGDMPNLTVLPVVADFTRDFELPAQTRNRPRVGFFPGSTIGNFEPHDAAEFLRQAGRILGNGATMIVGIDLIKGIVQAHPKVAVLVLTMDSDPWIARKALMAGALGYLTKDIAIDLLIEAVHSVAAGRRCVDPALSAALGTLPADRPPALAEYLSTRGRGARWR